MVFVSAKTASFFTLMFVIIVETQLLNEDTGFVLS